MSSDEKQKSWLEEEIYKQKSKINEPSKQDKTVRNRAIIARKFEEIGFVYNRHIGQDPYGVGRTYSYEQYFLFIKEYNMKVICSIGSEVIYVGVRDLESKECHYLFEYGTYGTYKFANDPSKYIEEFKFLLKHSLFHCLHKIGKERNITYYKLYDLEYYMEKRHPNTILNVFCDK